MEIVIICGIVAVAVLAAVLITYKIVSKTQESTIKNMLNVINEATENESE